MWQCRQEEAIGGQASGWQSTTQSTLAATTPFMPAPVIPSSSATVPAMTVPRARSAPAVSIGAALPMVAAGEGSQERIVTEQEVNNTVHVFCVCKSFYLVVIVHSCKQKIGMRSKACKQQKVIICFWRKKLWYRVAPFAFCSCLLLTASLVHLAITSACCKKQCSPAVQVYWCNDFQRFSRMGC